MPLIPLFHFRVDQQLATLSILNEVKTTVAIFVDRRPPGTPTNSQPFHNIVVPFIGGSNEREALKLAFRFQKAPNVRLTVLHLTVEGQHTYKVDTEVLRSAKSLAKDETVTFEDIKIENGDFNTVVVTLQDPKFDLVVMGRSTRLRSGFPNGKDFSMPPGGKRTSFVRRFSQRYNDMSDEEKIFGHLGEALYNAKGIPSMLIVHEPSVLPTNGHDAA